jgi:SAM-dependent methyltransferase
MFKFFDLIKQTFLGKTLQRIFLYWQIKKHCHDLSGVIVDLGSGNHPDYNSYWRLKPEKLVRVDIDSGKQPQLVADLNQPLPLPDNYADHVFLFNVLYILSEPQAVLKEVQRILKPGGKFYLYAPLIFNEAREPHDYWRFTSEGISRLLEQAGFGDYHLTALGERFTAGVYLSDKILYFSLLKLIARLFGLLLDVIWPAKLKRLHPCPIGYFITAKK